MQSVGAYMSVAFHGYYDGTGSPANERRGQIIGLAGYAAAPDVWDLFESEWWRVLADDALRPACRYLHMKEANALRGEFSTEKGWDRDRVRILLRDLFNRCFSPYGRHDIDPERVLVGAACSVDLDAYERVCVQYPHFAKKAPEALCVDHVVSYGIMHLVPSEVDGMHLHELVQRGRSIALFFDRNEPFLHHILRVWESVPWHRRTRVLKLVSSISQTDRETSAAIQAADFLAWHTNKAVASEGGDLEARLTTFFASRCYTLHYDYDELLKTARRWRQDGGYDAAVE